MFDGFLLDVLERAVYGDSDCSAPEQGRYFVTHLMKKASQDTSSERRIVSSKIA